MEGLARPGGLLVSQRGFQPSVSRTENIGLLFTKIWGSYSRKARVVDILGISHGCGSGRWRSRRLLHGATLPSAGHSSAQQLRLSSVLNFGSGRLRHNAPLSKEGRGPSPWGVRVEPGIYAAEWAMPIKELFPQPLYRWRTEQMNK